MTAKANAEPEIDRSSTRWFEEHTKPLWERYLLPLAPFRSYLECGIFEADSLLWAAENLVAKDGFIDGVDLWMPDRQWEHKVAFAMNAKEKAIARIRKFEVTHGDRPCIKIHQEDIVQWMCQHVRGIGLDDEIPGVFQLIFLDADKRGPEALTAMCIAWRLLEPEGVLVIDDTDVGRGRRLAKGALIAEAYHCFLSIFGHQLRVLYSTKRQAAIIKL